MGVSRTCLHITSIENWICRTFFSFPDHAITFQSQFSVEQSRKVAPTIKLKIKAKVVTTIKTNSTVLQVPSA